MTNWIGQVRAGDAAAAQKLWERYFRRLVGLARKKLQDAPRSAADEEDVALSAFGSFCHRAARGQFPQLADRDDLWRLLVTVTSRKALHLRRDEQRPKRGGGEVLHLADLSGASARGNPIWEQILDQEPTPAYAALLAEEWRRLLERLDEQLGAIAQYKLEGHTNQEIAGKLGYQRVTVQRKLRLIRQIWAEATAP